MWHNRAVVNFSDEIPTSQYLSGEEQKAEKNWKSELASGPEKKGLKIQLLSVLEKAQAVLEDVASFKHPLRDLDR